MSGLGDKKTCQNWTLPSRGLQPVSFVKSVPTSPSPHGQMWQRPTGKGVGTRQDCENGVHRTGGLQVAGSGHSEGTGRALLQREQEGQRRRGRKAEGVFVTWQIYLSESALRILSSLCCTLTASLSLCDCLCQADRRDVATACGKVPVWRGDREAHQSRSLLQRALPVASGCG